MLLTTLRESFWVPTWPCTHKNWNAQCKNEISFHKTAELKTCHPPDQIHFISRTKRHFFWKNWKKFPAGKTSQIIFEFQKQLPKLQKLEIFRNESSLFRGLGRHIFMPKIKFLTFIDRPCCRIFNFCHFVNKIGYFLILGARCWFCMDTLKTKVVALGLNLLIPFYRM